MMGGSWTDAVRLGVPSDADAATVRAAFALRRRAVHPDVTGPGRADPASDVAELVAARDQLLAHPPTPPPLPSSVGPGKQDWGPESPAVSVWLIAPCSC